MSGDCSGAAGLTAALSAPVHGATEASARWNLPGGLTLANVRIDRTTHGFGGAQQVGNQQTYFATTDAGTAVEPSMSLADGTHPDRTGDTGVLPATGTSLTVGVKCANPGGTDCAQSDPVSVDINKVGLQVTETAADPAPKFAVGGTRSPASDTPLPLQIQGTDDVGLLTATAQFDGGAIYSANYRDKDAKYAGCKDQDPSTAAMDLSIDVVCPTVETVSLDVPVSGLENRVHTLTTTVTDIAGHQTVKTQTIEVDNNRRAACPGGTSTQCSASLNIGTSGLATTPGSTVTTASNGGVAGASGQNCKTPRLSVELGQKPVRISKGVPVLRYKKRYRFSGRLTCIINGKRKSAPKRTRIDLRNLVGKRDLQKSGTTVHDGGKFTIIVAYTSSRTLVFRFTNSDGRRSQVSIKVKVEKAKKKKKK